MKKLTKTELDSMQKFLADSLKVSGNTPMAFYLIPICHPKEGTVVTYDRGDLTIYCMKCKAVTCVVTLTGEDDGIPITVDDDEFKGGFKQ